MVVRPSSDRGTSDDRSAPLVYARCPNKKRAEFTALGSSVPIAELRGTAVARLRELFHLDRRDELLGRSDAATRLMADLAEEAAGLIGRQGELHALLDAVHGTEAGVLWVHGAAGSGKSALMAKVACELNARPVRDCLVIVWRFRTGDPGCTREAFIRHAVTRLQHWSAPATAPVEIGHDLDALYGRMRELLRRVVDPLRVVFVLDGVDEIARRDSSIAELPFLCGTPRTLWICAGRADPALRLIFTPDRAAHVFPGDGLAPMSAEDIGAWLKRDAPPDQRDALVRAEPDGSTARWVDDVTRRAAGLPAYIALLLDDLRAGGMQVGRPTPQGLTAYFDDLLARSGVDDVAAVLPPLIASVALAAEAPGEVALTEILRAAGVLAIETTDQHPAIVAEALARARALLRLVPGEAHGQGIQPYHDELRAHIGRTPLLENARAKATAGLHALAADPTRVLNASARGWFFEVGIRQLLALRLHTAALWRLLDFDYLMQRLQVSEEGGAAGIMADLHRLRQADPAIWNTARPFLAFLYEHSHDLERRAAAIALLQAVLMEDWRTTGENIRSIVHSDAKKWLATRTLDCSWFRAHAVYDGDVNGAAVARRAVRTGIPTTCFVASPASNGGSSAIVGGADGSLRRWLFPEGIPAGALIAHPDSTTSAHLLRDTSRVLSGGLDGSITLSNFDDNTCIRFQEGHSAAVAALALSTTERFALSGSTDGSLGLWDLPSRVRVQLLAGHTSAVTGVVFLDEQRAVSASRDGTLRLWDLATGACLAVLEADGSPVLGVRLLSNGLVAATSEDSLRLWDVESKSCVRSHVEYGRFTAPITLPSSWVELWCDEFLGALVPRDPNAPPAADERPSIAGAELFGDSFFILQRKWGRSCMARFDIEGRMCTGVAFTPVEFEFLAPVGSDIALTASRTGELHLWHLDHQTGDGGGREVREIVFTPDGEFAVAGHDAHLRVWRLTSPRPVEAFFSGTYEGCVADHSSAAVGTALMAYADNDYEYGMFEISVVDLPKDVGVPSVKVPSATVALQVSLDDDFFVSEHSDGEILHHDILRGTTRPLPRHLQVRDAQLCKRALVFRGGDGLVVAYDIDSGALKASRLGTCFATSSDGVWAASVSGAGLEVWEVDNGRVHHNLPSCCGRVLALSTDGRSAVVQGGDSMVEVWGVEAGESPRRVFCCPGEVLRVTPDARLMLVRDAEGAFQLWSLDDGCALATWWPQTAVSAFALAPNGRVALGDVSGAMTILDLVSPT